MGPLIQYATESTNPIEVRIYPGANGHVTLYEDEGDNYDYEKGRYATLACHWNNTDQTLTLDATRGDFPGRHHHRQFQLVRVSQGRGVGVDVTSKLNQVVQYNGERHIVSLK